MMEHNDRTIKVKSFNFLHSVQRSKESVNDYSREELRHYVQYNLFHKNDNIFGKQVPSEYDSEALSGFSMLKSEVGRTSGKTNFRDEVGEVVTPPKKRRKRKKKKKDKDKKMIKLVNSCARLFTLFNKKRETREHRNHYHN